MAKLLNIHICISTKKYFGQMVSQKMFLCPYVGPATALQLVCNPFS